LFVCPNIGALVDEKLYFYTKYMKYRLLLEKGEKIKEVGYETVTLADCTFYLNKFAKAILALTYGLEQSRHPELSQKSLIDKQEEYVNKRLTTYTVEDRLKNAVITSLFSQNSKTHLALK
jgi:hypothetical protein